jgi:hypothetical protein
MGAKALFVYHTQALHWAQSQAPDDYMRSSKLKFLNQEELHYTIYFLELEWATVIGD